MVTERNCTEKALGIHWINSPCIFGHMMFTTDSWSNVWFVRLVTEAVKNGSLCQRGGGSHRKEQIHFALLSWLSNTVISPGAWLKIDVKKINMIKWWLTKYKKKSRHLILQGRHKIIWWRQNCMSNSSLIHWYNSITVYAIPSYTRVGVSTFPKNNNKKKGLAHQCIRWLVLPL